MADLADYWNDHKEYMEDKRQREGWVSNRFRTEKEQRDNANYMHKLNDEIDREIAKELKKLKIPFDIKSTHAFQVTIHGKKFMFYDGKNGRFVYIPQEKKKIYIYELEDLLQVKH